MSVSFLLSPCIVDAQGAHRAPLGGQEDSDMLVTIAVLLIVLWALGLITKVAVGGFIHLLLVAAIVIFLLSVISGRRAV